MNKLYMVKKVIEDGSLIYHKNIYGELVIENGFLNNIYINNKYTSNMKKEIKNYYIENNVDYVLGKVDFCEKNNIYFTGCSDLYEATYLLKNTDMYIFALIQGPYERVLKKLGFNELMISLLKDENKIKKILERFKEEVLKDIYSFYNVGIHGIMLGDDIAYNKGLLFSSHIFNKLFKEIYEEISNYSKKLSLNIIFHCCGKIDDLIPLVKNCGFQGIHGFDKWSNKNFFNNLNSCPKDFLFMGGFDFYEHRDMGLIKNKISILKNHISKGYPYLICSSGGLIRDYNYDRVCKILNEIKD